MHERLRYFPPHQMMRSIPLRGFDQQCSNMIVDYMEGMMVNEVQHPRCPLANRHCHKKALSRANPSSRRSSTWHRVCPFPKGRRGYMIDWPRLARKSRARSTENSAHTNKGEETHVWASRWSRGVAGLRCFRSLRRHFYGALLVIFNFSREVGAANAKG